MGKNQSLVDSCHCCMIYKVGSEGPKTIKENKCSSLKQIRSDCAVSGSIFEVNHDSIVL